MVFWVMRHLIGCWWTPRYLSVFLHCCLFNSRARFSGSCGLRYSLKSLWTMNQLIWWSMKHLTLCKCSYVVAFYLHFIKHLTWWWTSKYSSVLLHCCLSNPLVLQYRGWAQELERLIFRTSAAALSSPSNSGFWAQYYAFWSAQYALFLVTLFSLSKKNKTKEKQNVATRLLSVSNMMS